MALPLHELAQYEPSNSIVRLTENGLEIFEPVRAPLAVVVTTSLIPQRALEEGEQYRFHFDMTKCIGCRSCEIACNEQNNTPADLRWRRVGEIEGGSYPDTARHYLSMGCNHCLSAECIKGCPVDAYTKDPVTGIVLHSADACIGCQYCVWNCPYSVPQFNPERGVVGKCDMCHGRLTDGLEPACVNACPENAIQIEIVDKMEWRSDYALAEAPGMPAAVHSISTTRITLPEKAKALSQVDENYQRLEHAHWSLVWMTTLIQLSAGGVLVAIVTGRATVVTLLALLALTAFTLSLSVLHLGRPAYAWRAMKAWRRSWLSREVVLFSLYFLTLSGLAAATGFGIWHAEVRVATLISAMRVLVPVLGFAGILASACIYLVPARPAWNMEHTPIDFVLSALLLGVAAAPVLIHLEVYAYSFSSTKIWASATPFRDGLFPLAFAATCWSMNLAVRAVRLLRTKQYERRASATLLMSYGLRGTFLVSFALVALGLMLAASGSPLLALPAVFAGVVASRYLFFVSVVPLNMALTFVRSVHA